MKRILLSLCAAGLLVLPLSANATALTGTVTRLPGWQTSSTPGVKIVLSAALTTSDTYSAVFGTDGLLNFWDGGSATLAGAIAWGFNTTTAGDSATVNIAGGYTTSGPWTDLYVSTLQANTLTGATNMQYRDDALTTLKPYPYFKISGAGKGASMATTKYFVVLFPRIR